MSYCALPELVLGWVTWQVIQLVTWPCEPHMYLPQHTLAQVISRMTTAHGGSLASSVTLLYLEHQQHLSSCKKSGLMGVKKCPWLGD
eukprot:15344766-Ditylum_brightwellii.AAC.1